MITNLDTLTGPAPLFLQYPGQCNPQRAYVKLTADGRVCYYANAEIGNGVSCDIFNGTARHWSVPNDLTARGYEQLHDDIAEMLQEVSEGMSEKWNGNNTVGRLTEEASDASDALEFFLHDARAGDYERDEEHLMEISRE
jgi:hypothetical protein